MSYSIHEIEELHWGFDGGSPTLSLPTERYTSSQQVDPFPCYAHNPKIVAEMMEKVTKDFPIKFDTKVFNMHYEGVGRTNAYMSYISNYDSETEPKEFHPYIVLHGKRIPPHPAVTRYLIAHEYGHVVDYYISWCKKLAEGKDEQRAEYAKMRGLTPPSNYGGRTWHQSVGEVFANDFRILVCNTELEYWVHEVPPPQEVPEVVEWWQDALKYKYLTN